MYVTGPCPRFVRGGGQEHVSIFQVIFVVWGRHRWVLLHYKVYTFHDLLYVCGGEGYCELLVNFADLLFIVHAI